MFFNVKVVSILMPRNFFDINRVVFFWFYLTTNILAVHVILINLIARFFSILILGLKGDGLSFILKFICLQPR